MFSGVVQAFTDSMRRAGYHVMLSISGYEDADDETLFRALLGRRPDALLVTGSAYSPGALQMLVEARIPVVEIWDVSARPIDMVIGFDHARVGADVAAFFHRKGHTRFATLLATDSRALTRGRGFTDEARRLGGTVAFEQVLPAPSTIAAGREGLRALLPHLQERLALFCSSDLLAFGVLTEARVQGVTVPDRLAVCGFGNFELSEMNEPPITTVNVEGVQTGRNAAAVLLRRLAGEQSHQPEQVEVPFRIIERAST